MSVEIDVIAAQSDKKKQSFLGENGITSNKIKRRPANNNAVDNKRRNRKTEFLFARITIHIITIDGTDNNKVPPIQTSKASPICSKEFASVTKYNTQAMPFNKANNSQILKHKNIERNKIIILKAL